jgi:hypothetical protein
MILPGETNVDECPECLEIKEKEQEELLRLHRIERKSKALYYHEKYGDEV